MSTRILHHSPIARASSMNCDGLTQIVRNPRAICAGIDAIASSRSATLCVSTKRPRVPPTYSISSVERPAVYKRRFQLVELLVAWRTKRVEALSVTYESSHEARVDR